MESVSLRQNLLPTSSFVNPLPLTQAHSTPQTNQTPNLTSHPISTVTFPQFPSQGLTPAKLQSARR